ncbi:UNVERIFIED_ORG: hypothetical protein ABIC54_004435 [Burkholderia sp. 1263]
MKPFDLKKAIAGDPLVTRDGRSARLIGHAPEFEESSRVIVAIEGVDSARQHYESGAYTRDAEHGSDLFMAPKKRTVWVNVYETRLNTIRNHGNCAAVFDTEEGARSNADGNGIRVTAIAVPIEIED